MEKPIIPVELEAMDARVKAATPGPWRTEYEANDFYLGGKPSVLATGNVRIAEFLGWVNYPDANAEFVAHARADVPRLIEALREEQAASDAHYKRSVDQTVLIEGLRQILETQRAVLRKIQWVAMTRRGCPCCHAEPTVCGHAAGCALAAAIASTPAPNPYVDALRRVAVEAHERMQFSDGGVMDRDLLTALDELKKAAT